MVDSATPILVHGSEPFDTLTQDGVVKSTLGHMRP